MARRCMAVHSVRYALHSWYSSDIIWESISDTSRRPSKAPCRFPYFLSSIYSRTAAGSVGFSSRSESCSPTRSWTTTNSALVYQTDPKSSIWWPTSFHLKSICDFSFLLGCRSKTLGRGWSLLTGRRFKRFKLRGSLEGFEMQPPALINSNILI